ncbi:MAG: hypothetical protein JSV78_02325 [Phycisphaerales bacterium]|nr:MAG: hypothetical protein JSV78_02325 [Phycisphaerales bacterium]
MFSITDAAGAHLAKILEEETCPDDVAIRFVHEGQGIAMKLDGEREGDATFEHEGRTVLRLDQGLAQLLEHETLDVEPMPDGVRFTLKGEEGSA